MQLLQLLLSLSILVAIHEFGHFIFAKLFKVRVEKFYLFFDFLFPFANLANFSLFKKKVGETEYGIGWFPLGGYVQITGMVDEQMDKSVLQTEPQPWEFRSKPAWQRLLIMLGGILMNVILGVVIYWMILLVWGKEYIPANELKYGIQCDSVALSMGLKNGDQIISIDNKPVESIEKIALKIVINQAKSIQVKRNGQIINIPITEQNLSDILANVKNSMFVMPRTPVEVDSIIPHSYADDAGLRKGDIIIQVDTIPVFFFDEYQSAVLKYKGKEKVPFKILRNNDTIVVHANVSLQGTLGFVRNVEKYLPIKKETYSLSQAIKQGTKNAWENIVMQVKQFSVLFKVKNAHKQVGGFYSMYKAMPEKWDWRAFWSFTAFLSLVLAFMNFLPIPMLDGGYILFTLFEMITGIKVPDKVIYYANQVGLFILLALMIWANTDWLRN
ncbi:MAG TPA: RIP metalloprotease RseP [Bacteroidia bacterium]|nr:RIP metalloprotease RseP [Bacteroidia bacterium]